MNSVKNFDFDDNNKKFNIISFGLDFRPFYHDINEFANNFPDKIAITFNKEEWTYREIADFSDRISKSLISTGVKKGDIIGLAVDRSAKMIIMLLGILKSGAAYLPLDPTYPKDRVEFMLSDSSASILITSEKYNKSFKHDAKELLLEDLWNKLNITDVIVDTNTVLSNDLAYILYTSGSTGKPKGVMITHKNVSNFLKSMLAKPGINRSDKLLAISTISFDIAFFELFLPLVAGAQIMIVDTETAKDGWLLLEIIKKENITLMQATPYTWRMLIAAGWKTHLPLKIISGGERLPRDLAEKLLKLCREVWNQYGPTETTVYSTQKLIESADDVNIGNPIENTQIYILNNALQPVSEGEIGEIFIGGHGVSKGYLNRQKLTDESFIDNPFFVFNKGKIYKTGDFGKLLKNGEIQCLGRADSQIKLRGFRIELEEIEYALMSVKDVVQAVAHVISDQNGISKLIAYIVLSVGIKSRPEKGKLKESLDKMLPPYMIPDDFVFLKDIPTTANGKIDRNALPGLKNSGLIPKRAVIHPETILQSQLWAMWKKMFEVKKLSISDNFFDLGGHSLLAVQIMAKIAKITGKRLPIATLLKYPTIIELASFLEEEDAANSLSSLVPINPKGSKPPIYIIHGEGLNVMYFNDLAANLHNEQPVFGLQARGLKGEDPLDVMEDIAASYINEILFQHNEGPIILAGYSFGGYVAVDMRRQLKLMGKEVKLIIFDTDAEKSEYKSWLYLLPRKFKRNLPRVPILIKNNVSQLIEIFYRGSKGLTNKPTESEESEAFYLQIRTIKNKLRKALRNYTIEPFDDKIYLYKANICTHYVDDVDFLGWKKYAKKGVEVYEVSGDHLSMLLQPNVEFFAHILQENIDKWSLSG